MVQISIQKNNLVVTVQGCADGRMHRLPFPKKSHHRGYQVLEIIDTDVCGPMHVPSIGGLRYYATFIDDHSRLTTIYFLKSKGQVFEKFKEFAAAAENQTVNKIMVLKSDNGG